MGSYIVEDVCLTDDYFLNKHKYFLSSESRGKYFKLNKTQYDFFYSLIPVLKNTDDREEIEKFLMETSNGNMGISQLDKILKRYNIFFESFEERKGSVEAEFTSNKLFELSLEGLQKKGKTLLNILWWILLFVSMISILGMTVLWLGEVTNLSFIDFRRTASCYKTDGTYNWLLLIIGTIMCIVVHELGHLLSANHFGIEYKSITVALKWGISPIYYIRYKNFYHHPSLHKLISILSGVWMNLFKVSVYYIVGSFIPMRELDYLILMNLMGILNNILPKGTSDGYHAFCILIGIEGIRWKMLRRVSLMLNCKDKRNEIIKDRETRLLILYFFTSYGISIYGCFNIFKAVLSYLTVFDNKILEIGLQILVGIIIFLGLSLNIVKLKNNVKRMNGNAQLCNSKP